MGHGNLQISIDWEACFHAINFIFSEKPTKDVHAPASSVCHLVSLKDGDAVEVTFFRDVGNSLLRARVKGLVCPEVEDVH